MRVLITGASGMVGHYLVEKCIEREYSVVATDIRYNDVFDKYNDLFRFEFKQADLTNFEKCKEVVKDIDVVFHVAGVKELWNNQMIFLHHFYNSILI